MNGVRNVATHCWQCENCGGNRSERKPVGTLLTAVRSVELDEGCPEDSRVPRIGELYDALIEMDDGEKYARRAVEMFPELATHMIVLAIAKKGGDTR